jgi:hypothetical protein
MGLLPLTPDLQELIAERFKALAVSFVVDCSAARGRRGSPERL